MRLHHLHIDGFGRFAAPSDFVFDPEGLTVVYGDNERGKTTMKDAICATIFGFWKSDEKNKYRPWNSFSYAAGVTFSSKGNLYRIERDFDTDQVTVWDISGEEKQIIFQGVANLRGKGTDHEAYFDFVEEQIGFSSPDIFRLTTLIEQMQTKTKISEKIRELISGSEKADYAKVAETLESELEEITRDVPWKNLRKKREIEETDEKIRELSRAIADAQENLITACQVEAQIQTLEEDVEKAENESDKKRKSLETLGKYIQIEKDLSGTQRNLKLLQDQIEALQEITERIEGVRSIESGSFKIPLIIGAAGVAISVALWLILENLLLVIVALISGILLSVFYHFYSLRSRTSSRGIEIDAQHREDIEQERNRLQEEIFSLRSQRDNICAQYPSFVQADVNQLLPLQENINQAQERLEEKIKQKEEELYDLKVKLGATQQNIKNFHSWEEERKILEENREHLERRKKALIMAISVFQECIKEYQFKYIGKLESYITGAFKKITNERYRSVILEEDTLEPLVSTKSKSHITRESLSIGTLEQLYFAMRLSMAYLLSGNLALPFLLDDSFVSYDDSRLDNIKYILSRVKRKNQVVLFVHDSFYTEWADTVIDLNRHDE